MDVRGVVSCYWSSGNIPIYVRYGIPSAPLCTLQMNLLIIAEALFLITDRVEGNADSLFKRRTNNVGLRSIRRSAF
jgi:hypothetical protein